MCLSLRSCLAVLLVALFSCTADPTNDCANNCEASDVCDGGACTLQCAESQTLCDASCVNLESDRANCGSCGHSCDAGQVCSQGTCALSCQSGLSECDGGCVNLQTDRAYCGSCSNYCGAGLVCSAGACKVSCQAGLTSCGGSCVNLKTDRAYCGSCGTACSSGFVCNKGQCELSCQSGLTSCGGSCVNLQSDRAYCGDCDNACPSGYVCSQGQCAVSCAAPLLECSSACVDTRYDPSHCGGCDAACGDYAHGSAFCASGTCGLALCDSGYDNCDGDSTNGCETDLSTTATSCGSCTNACGGGRNCTSGACDKRVFVTSALYDGNLGGLDGADAKCQALADAAGIGGTYRAWLAIDASNSPATRFTHSDGAYTLVDGTVIANSYGDLTDGELLHAIDLTERGLTPPASTDFCGTSAVWSNTGLDGEGYSSGASVSCAGFTNTTGQSQFGRYDRINGLWSAACTSAKSCSHTSPLYCFEQ